MKTLIVCSSVHRGNTRKIAKAMADVLGAEVLKPDEVDMASLGAYELVGFGSGVYGGRFHKSMLELVRKIPLSKDRKAFVFSTSWRVKEEYNERMKNMLIDKGFDIAGDFCCKGFNCFGPFKLVGGLNKGRPNEEDIERARDFARKLKSQECV